VSGDNERREELGFMHSKVGMTKSRSHMGFDNMGLDNMGFDNKV
jgi:hypothetical protein